MSATTNGASLEDCLTNIFSLIDLNGLRWKRFKHKENNNYLCTPIDTHPILTTYAKCIEENHIAVWRHEPQKRHSSGGGGGGGNPSGGHGNSGSVNHSNFPTPTRTSNNNTPTNAGPANNMNNSSNSGNQHQNNSSQTPTNNYELWIFGYGHQLRVENVIGDDLVEIEDDTWESKGLSYECRTLLFKALHNLIERCLITKGFTKIGRWFVQPSSENYSNTATNAATSVVQNSSTTSFNKPSTKRPKIEQQNSIISSASSPSPASCVTKTTTNTMSSSISSTINRIIETRREIFDSRQCLDKSDGLRHTSIRSSSAYFTTSLDGSKSSLSLAFSFFVHGDSTICVTVDVRQHPLVHPLTRADLTAFQEGGIVRVALAPFGLNGILNGVSYKDSDNGAATTTFIQQWSKFYPLPKTLARLVPGNKSSNSAMSTSNFNQKPSSNTSNQFNQANDVQTNQGSRSYLSNLTNMLLPPTQKPFLCFEYEPNEVPPVVEVIVAGYRMRYPSECVFTTSRVVDLYKSLNLPTHPKSVTSSSSKRPNKNSPNKPNKLSLLSEKLSEDRSEPQTRIKSDPDQAITQSNNFNDSLFRLSSADGNNKFTTKTEGPTSIDFNRQHTGSDNCKDVSSNGCSDPDNSNNLNTNQTTISRFNPTRVGFSSNNTPLGPTDLVKLFPTPPSLEQIVLSPTTITEEIGAKDITTVTSSPGMNQNHIDILKDSSIDVYRPSECAVIETPPKWAALTNIIISSAKTVRPDCVYKVSSQNKNSTSKNIINRFCNVTKNSLTKSFSISKQLNNAVIKSASSMQQPVASPLTDQTNKNGFNCLNLNSSSSIKTSSLLTSSLSNSASFSHSSDTTSTVTSSTTTTFSSFTLPHRRLFNNLHEVSAIQLNLMISDSILGMFKDHNFESCTLCVCSMSIKGSQIDTIPQRIDNQWRQSMASDSLMTNSPYSNEFSNECTCGFSASTNRHCSHLSGLFLEDELELTNVLYDPTEMIDQNKLFRRIRLSNYPDNSYSDEQKVLTKLLHETNLGANNKGSVDSSLTKVVVKQEKSTRDDKSSQSSHTLFEETKVFVIDQLKQQCSSMIHSNSSLSKVLLIESFRNNRHLTSCTNYYAQTTNKTGVGGLFQRFLDDSSKYTSVKMMNRNPMSLKFSDFCELTKNIITKLGQSSSKLSNNLMKPMGGTGSSAMPGSSLSSIFMKMFGGPNRQNLLSKTTDLHSNNRNNIFLQGLQALVIPTLALDPNGALHMLEYLVKDESKEALATLNKAILIFSTPIHDWQFLTAPIPENNFDVANLLKIIQPSLDESIGSHNKLYKDFVHQQQQHIFSARDSPTGAPVMPTPPCQGPLTWRQFHQSAGRGTEDQCEPQPIPSLLVTHHVEKNHLAVSPFALKFWDKLLLEPYAPGHNMYYLVITPDDQNLLGHVNPFFKELSNTYELLKLGKHIPIGTGIIMANSTTTSDNSNDDDNSWFSKLLGTDKDLTGGIIPKLKDYAAKLNPSLAKTIVDFMEERQPPYDPHADRFDSSPNPQQTTKSAYPPTNRLINHPPQVANRTFNSLLGVGSTPSSNQTLDNFGYPTSSENQTISDPMGNHLKSQTLIGSGVHGNAEDHVHIEDEAHKQSGIVIYIVDPFASPAINQNLRALSTIGLMKCYSILLDNLPENIKRVTQLQLISLDSIISRSRPLLNVTRVDQLKSLSMNVYSRCRKILANQTTAKSLTGFGPAAALENFFKTKSPELSVSRMFTPPFILAPMKDKQTELGEMFGDRREKSSVLFCSYCITEDQRWLLASITNDKGEMSDTTVININVIDRPRRPKASVKRIALRKLMDFIVSVMSDWMNPWRLIIGKLGRVGHGELIEWATLMSKRSLLGYSRQLTERCRQCSILPPTETVSILSACLVSLEPDSKLRIMPDQFTSDDRQASFNKCPLSTPEDASATHILVFPTSASIQSAHGNVEDLVGSGLDDDLLNQFPLEDGIEDLGVEENMDDLFCGWDDAPTNNDHINPHHDTMMSSSNLQMGGGSVGDSTNNQDETLQLLQQPLALGYYISTARIGQMPNWFWSTSPHLRNSSPVFLKSALHIHMPCVQHSDDLLHSGVGQTRKSHQLDSNLTTDVLRYVLEGYNSLSWLALNPKTYDRQSCLPVHMQNLLQLYHLMESFS